MARSASRVKSRRTLARDAGHPRVQGLGHARRDDDPTGGAVFGHGRGGLRPGVGDQLLDRPSCEWRRLFYLSRAWDPGGRLLATGVEPEPAPGILEHAWPQWTWTIHVQARVVGTMAPIYAAGITLCVADGTTRSSVNVTLDQDAPVARIAITSYTDATGPHPALPCDDFTKGVTIHGTFDITDNMGVGTYSLVAEPSGLVVDVVDPGSTSTHVFGTWTLATE